MDRSGIRKARTRFTYGGGRSIANSKNQISKMRRGFGVCVQFVQIVRFVHEGIRSSDEFLVLRVEFLVELVCSRSYVVYRKSKSKIKNQRAKIRIKNQNGQELLICGLRGKADLVISDSFDHAQDGIDD
jgi:hypothetical protein